MDKSVKDNMASVMDGFTNEEIDGLFYDCEEYEEAIVKAGVEEKVEEASKKALEQGITTRNLAISKNMLQKSIDKKTIIEVTGITLEELEKI